MKFVFNEKRNEEMRRMLMMQPTMEEGMLAVRKLIRMIFGGKEKTELIKPYLIVRESSGGGPEEEIISEYHD